MVRSSRRGGPYPRVGCNRSCRFGRSRRTSRLPGAARAGGGLARSAWPRGQVAAQAAAAGPTGEQQPPAPHPSALVALAWVHLEHHELREARSRLTQADAALGVAPDRLIGAVAALAAAYGALAGPRPAVAAQVVARARCGWSVPAWLDHRLSQA